MTRLFLGLPAPAKLNLFLHVRGRRPDGYHELQSVLVPTSLADSLDFMRRADGRIERDGDVIGEVPRDLALRAAQLLQQAAGTPLGATITVRKRIPAGSGMGGGSSDAATTLLALNRLWSLDWPREQLLHLAGQLGADVPFFLGAGPAFVEGIGERSTALAPGALGTARWAAVVWPQVHVSTVEIFNDPNLTRSAKATIIGLFRGAVAWRAGRYQRPAAGRAAAFSRGERGAGTSGAFWCRTDDRFGFRRVRTVRFRSGRAGSSGFAAAGLPGVDGALARRASARCVVGRKKGFALGSRQAG